MKFEEILKPLHRLESKISMKHPAEKADLFIEFLGKKIELTNMFNSFKEFTELSFKEELEDEK